MAKWKLVIALGCCSNLTWSNLRYCFSR